MGDMTAGEEENLLIQEIFNKLNLIEKHKSVVDHQNKNFTNNIKSLTQDDCIIISDFKENLKIGGGPEETKQMFFNKEQVSVLGFALIYWEDGLLKMDYITYLSNQLTHDSRFTGQCLTGLFQEKVKNEFKNIYLWTDGGKHFCSKEYLCFQLQISKQIEGFFKHNFFAEYHGKNFVDGHFGRLSQWFKKIEAVQKIETVDQLLVLFESEEATRVTNFYSSNPGKILSGENYFYKYEVYERANKEFIDIEDI